MTTLERMWRCSSINLSLRFKNEEAHMAKKTKKRAAKKKAKKASKKKGRC